MFQLCFHQPYVATYYTGAQDDSPDPLEALLHLHRNVL